MKPPINTGKPPLFQISRKRGVYQISRDPKFGLIAYKWQRPRGPNGTPAQMQARADFATAVKYVNQVASIFRQAADETTKGSQWTYKDRLISVMYGKGTVGITPDGEYVMGYADMSDFIQAALDSISDAVGSILVRTPTGWAGLIPGAASTVITSKGGEQVPDYEAQSGGGGAGMTIFTPLMVLPGSNVLYEAGYYQLTPCILPGGSKANAISFIANAAQATTELTPVLYLSTGTSPGALARSGPTVTGVQAGINVIPLDGDYAVDVDTLVWPGIGIAVANFSGATGTPVPYAYYSHAGAPLDPAPVVTRGTGGNNAHAWLTYVQ